MNQGINEIPRQEAIEYFATLGIPADKIAGLTPEGIKKAYRKRAKETHPDQGGNEDEFKKVNHAYQMLTDPEYRVKDRTSKAKTSPIDLNIRVTIPCTFEDAFFGKKLTISFTALSFPTGERDIEKLLKSDQVKVVTRTVIVNVPAGALQGHQETQQGLGHEYDGQVGNLDIQVASVPRPDVVQLSPVDIASPVMVPLSVMLKGGKIEVLTMYGIKTLWVPPGTQPGTRLEAKRCGVQQIGSHFFVVQPIYPTKQELKNKDWTPLGINWAEHQAEIEKENEEIQEMFQRARKPKE